MIPCNSTNIFSGIDTLEKLLILSNYLPWENIDFWLWAIVLWLFGDNWGTHGSVWGGSHRAYFQEPCRTIYCARLLTLLQMSSKAFKQQKSIYREESRNIIQEKAGTWICLWFGAKWYPWFTTTSNQAIFYSRNLRIAFYLARPFPALPEHTI